jgi:hypothetical protein
MEPDPSKKGGDQWPPPLAVAIAAAVGSLDLGAMDQPGGLGPMEMRERDR